ncbi:transketolase [Candidatus Pseudoscillospira sp. SGI.172]|uniref:transketolase n=1 Tax=Candidatus Pseudoscillospira sp. SGI.172 TaxID=3420582 RepID=UPI002A788C12|nr:transketolase [Pseudoflavonifractor sp.]MDY3019412.1 transketolase [Oscillospiraceae bacterium]
MEARKLHTLELAAAKIRSLAMDQVYTAASGHIGGSLSVADILTVLYFDVMKVDPENPQAPDRDRLVLSKGHTTPALYAALALRGYFPKEELKLFRSIRGHMSGHPDMVHVPGVDMSTGSLGQGISAAVGMALAGKIDRKDYRVYAVLGDGEIEEGQVWEAAMAAAKYRLDNLTAVVDVNGLQIDGSTADVMPSEPLDKKFEAFNWNVIHVDGHDLAALEDAFAQAAACTGKPTVLLAGTVKGKGVSFMENDAGWHGKAPNEEQYAVAREELRNRVRICTDVAAVDSMDDAVEVLEKLGLMDEEGEN